MTTKSYFALIASCLGLGIIHAEPFSADWNSLRKYERPQWFQDAKFGIYTHWGPYSATMAPDHSDWYGRKVYGENGEMTKFHLETYGPLSEFGYKDIIPKFTAENFDADEWVKLFIEAGARFAGPVGEHADGFPMWASKQTKWNAANMGPKRDIVAEMEKAIRKTDLKFMVSMHHQWKYGWFSSEQPEPDSADPHYQDLYGPSVPMTGFSTKQANGKLDPMRVDPMPDQAFADDWLARVKEVVTGYQPDLLWFDNRMQILPEQTRKEMAAFYYNSSHENQREAVLSYKRPDLIVGTGTVDLERSRMPDIYPDPWLTDTSIAKNTWSYVTAPEYYSADRLTDDLIDIVSKNGCLLLNIAPAPDGTIPDEQREILRSMGAWLKINGEAIYSSRPWFVYGEGDTKAGGDGHLGDLKFNGFGPEDIRFTTSGQTLYAIALDRHEDNAPVTIEELSETAYNDEIKGITLLGYSGDITWTRDKQSLSITIPEDFENSHAYVFKIHR
ncbi:alpha-L-fucosidase [Luteolibacter algae]|uniref:alpha-L-fucosidase n=1 Tax=Luteolibacter algae TaxID=454151 RepID=A0ABW5D5V9_9BACT